MPSFFLLAWRQLRAKPFRSFLTLTSIALGVALYTSIDVVNYSTLKSFETAIESISGKAQLTLMAGENGFDESWLERVEHSPVVQNAIPLVETHVFYQDQVSKSTETLMILGVDLLKESSVRAYQTEDQKVIDDPLTFLNQPDSLILTRAFAEKHGYRTGDQIRLSTAAGTKTFTIRGLLNPEGPAKAYGGHLGIMDIDGARMQFGKQGKLDRIDIIPKSGIKSDQVRSSLESAFSPTLTVESPESQSENMKKLVEGYQGLLSFVGLLSLIVGLFLVLNTTNISIAERRREFGILRALGATRSTLFQLLGGEALLMGAVGSVMGVFAGQWVARTMSGLITRALSNQYLIPVYVGRVSLAPEHWIKGMGLGTFVTILAALIAARNTLRIEAIEAVKGVNRKPRMPGFTAPVVGFILLALIVLDSSYGLSQSRPMLRFLNPFFLIFGAVLLSPTLVRGLIHGVRMILPFPSIRFSTDNLIRNAERTGANIMTLMVGLMLVIILSVLNGSIKYSVTSWFDKTLAADLVVSSTGKLLTFQVQPLHEEIKAKLDSVPGVDITNGIGASGLRYVKQKFQGKTLAIKAFDRPHPRLVKSQFDITEGDPDEVLDLFFGVAEPLLLVSQNFVMKFGYQKGDSIDLNTPTGMHRFRIIGVVAEFTNPEGVFYLNRETYKKFWKDELISGFFIMAKPGFPPLQLRQEIDKRFGQSLGLMVTMNSELAVQARGLVDESFTYTKAIEWSALLVGLFGLFNTLMVSVLERTREFGVLRTLGMMRNQLFAMILSESVIQGALGGIVAIAIGVFISYFWIMGTLSGLLGWVLKFNLPKGALLGTFAWGLFVGILAGLLPATRVAKLEIRDALERD
jgi:putative ABC transport system permease protein